MSYLEESWNQTAATLGYHDEEHMLRGMYLVQSMSINQIAKVLGFSPFMVRMRLLRLKVKLRGRGGPQRHVRKLAHLSDHELFHFSNGHIQKEHNVHSSTVSAERRLRKKMKEEAA